MITFFYEVIILDLRQNAVLRFRESASRFCRREKIMDKFKAFSVPFAALALVTVFMFTIGAISLIAQDPDENEEDPVEIFNRGQAEHEKGNLAEALKLYEKAIEIAPEFPEAEFQKGNVLVSLNRIVEAEAALRRAIGLRAGWDLPVVSLGELLINVSRFSEAETLALSSLQTVKENSELLVLLAEAQLGANRTGDILKNTKILLLDSRDKTAGILATIGAIERRLGNEAAAKAGLEESLRKNPKERLALRESALLAENSGDLEGAAGFAQRLLSAAPRSVAAKLLLARINANRGKVEDALSLLDSVEETNADVIRLRSEIIAGTSSDVSALEEQLKSQPKNTLLLNRLCILTRTVPTKSLEFCRRAAEADPNNINPAVGYGAALVQAREFSAAVELFRKLLTFEPENYTIRANLATALFELKRYSEAKAEFSWVVRKRPDLAVAYYFLAITHDNLAEYEEAMTSYRSFLRFADSKTNQLEIDKVNLRLPGLEKQIKQGGGRKKGAKT
jgi:tetratricopeptide (TPR) repeat protein